MPLTPLQLSPTQDIPLRRLQGMTMEALRDREILEPHYAGFDPQFRAENYVTVDIREPRLRTKVLASLEQFGRTPQGQQVMRQALAAQTHRDSTGQLEGRDAHDDHRIRISDVSARESRNSRTDSVFLYQNNIIDLSSWEIRHREFAGQDGRYYDFSVQHVLSHELLHAADALSGPRNAAAVERAMRQRYPHLDTYGVEDVMRTLNETPVIRQNNRFMGTHYNEMARSLDYSDFRNELPVLSGFTTQPTLGADHFYNELAPSATPVPARTDAKPKGR